MPNQQRHRGKHPEDSKLFAPQYYPVLKEAVRDMCYLLSRGYSEANLLQIVGDRYFLHARQRLALKRICCAEQSMKIRREKEVFANDLLNQTLYIDGYNVLIITESLLSGGMLFKGVDGCYRDIASIHSTYKKVEETTQAIHLLGKVLGSLGAKEIFFYLDTPVSNSGRLKNFMQTLANENGWNWQVALAYSPDRMLKIAKGVIISADGIVLDETIGKWFNLLGYIIEQKTYTESIETAILDLTSA